MSSPAGGSWPTIPGFDLVRVIGRGGFGTVYEARQRSVDRAVALKVLAADRVDADAERRFRAEARAVGALSWHPHVVSLYDAGVTPDGELYLVMELVPGGSLGAGVRSGSTLGASDLVRVGAQVSDALGAAHAAGVLHRDVKPDNILIDRRGAYLLGDFGIARLDDGTRSATGSFTGTYAFSAPEVLGGERATEASDLYSLGATLHALAGGRAPFARESDASPAAQLVRIVQEATPPLPATVPEPLAQLVLQLMAKDPHERPTSAAEVLEAFRSLEAQLALAPEPGEGASTVPPSVAGQLPTNDVATVGPTDGSTVVRPRKGSDRSEPVDDGPTVEPPSEPPSPVVAAKRPRWLPIAGALLLLLAAVAAVVLLRDDGTGRDPVVGTVDLELRPVLGQRLCPDATATTAVASDDEENGMGAAGSGSGESAASGQFSPTTTTSAPTTTTAPTRVAPTSRDALRGTLLPSADGTLCYDVGEVGGTGKDLTDAEAVLEQGEWRVSVRVRAASVDGMNELFNACYEADATCPALADGRGKLAVVIDGVVVSAPAVNGPDLADDAIVITGAFTEAEAKDLAAGLS